MGGGARNEDAGWYLVRQRMDPLRAYVCVRWRAGDCSEACDCGLCVERDVMAEVGGACVGDL